MGLFCSLGDRKTFEMASKAEKLSLIKQIPCSGLHQQYGSFFFFFLWFLPLHLIFSIQNSSWIRKKICPQKQYTWEMFTYVDVLLWLNQPSFKGHWIDSTVFISSQNLRNQWSWGLRCIHASKRRWSTWV